MDDHPLTIDHISFSVADLDAAKAFYSAALAPLGIEVVAEFSAEITGDAPCVGFGKGRKGTFWITGRGRQTPTSHICFRAQNRAEVRAFYAAALAAGGVDNGAPGIRAIYDPAYYGAFVIDAEGHNIEAVTFAPK